MRRRTLIPFLIVALSLLVAPPAANARVCVPTSITGLVVWLPGQADGIPQYDNQALATALYAMRGPHFGYRRGDYVRMHIPIDWNIEARFWLLPGRQLIWFMSAPSEPEHVWIYWFPDNPVYAVHTPVSGDHYGIHPCNDLVVSRSAAEAIYQLIKE